MCGICGIALKDTQKTPDRTALERMTRVLKHRGPDEENVWLKPGIGLGHQRLSIIDLSTGSQPMQDESGRFTITFNGEIYNFQELRKNLEKKGHTFRTTSDTEVLLKLYKDKGRACVHDLRGMFAFAVWDSGERELFIARDRLGKKPFYYALWRDQLIFASEIKSILQVEDFPREVCPEAVSAYFAYTYIPYPLTAFRYIAELPPAHTLTWKGGEVTTQRYWRLSFDSKREMSADEAGRELWQILKESTALRMISDVPLGVFLSGGIDSSTIVAAMAEITTEPVKTFSIGFEESSHNELPFARQIAEKFGTQHEEFMVKPNAMEILPKMIWHYDQPFSDSSALPTFYVAQMASQRVKVVLNGDGGDENFCGYDRYQMMHLWEMLFQIPLSVRSKMAGIFQDREIEGNPYHVMSRIHRFMQGLKSRDLEKIYERYMIQFPPAERRKVFSDEFQKEAGGYSPESFIRELYAAEPSESPLSKIISMEYSSYLPGDLLVKMDRATMAYGLEARSPFLDHRLIEFAASLPLSFKIRGLTLKYLLKSMMRKKLPGSILGRPKAGFGVPVNRWFRTSLAQYARDILLDTKTLARPYFKAQEIKRYLAEHDAGTAGHGHRIWSFIVFELWHRTFIDRKGE